jgi:uncharacterized protein with NAD-binding domain and iron-sulfur cluster
MKKVAIFGGGVGGCSVAHELSKCVDKNGNPFYDITIYEKKYEIGGLARSNRDEDGCATEYCWRVYFDFYKNVFKVMSEISLNDDNKKTVLNNLTKCSHRNVSDLPFSLKDKIISYKNVFDGMTSCDDRLIELDNLTWQKSLEGTNNSHLFRAIGPWLGGDRYNYSYKSVIRVGFEMDMYPGIFDSTVYNYVTTKPTSEAWFNHWTAHLKKQGVKINFGESLFSVRINEEKSKILSTVVIDDKNNTFIVEADYYVFSLPVEVLDIIVKKTPKLQIYEQFRNIEKLKNIALHMQLSFQLYFDRSISLGIGSSNIDTNDFLLVDSPWDIIVLQYDKIYKDTKLCEKLPNVKGGWSVAACTAYIPGIIYGKPFNKCNYEEIITELWAQMYTSKELQRIIMKNNGYYLDKSMVIKWSPMWPTYKFNEKTGYLETSEPKFTNNAGTYKLRPSYKTDINNLFISTAYIKETLDIFSMEAACISGKYVAHEISKKDIKSIKNCTLPPIIVKRPALLSPLRAIDSFFYKLGLPNMSLIIVIIVIIMIIILVIKFLKK